MLNILSILTYTANQLLLDKARYNIIDSEHILDTKTGVEFHLYDDYFKVTRGDELIATKGDFTEQEQEALWAMKQKISSPEEIQRKKDSFKEDLLSRRNRLSHLFEVPEVLPETSPVAEAGTQEYVG